MDMEHILSQMTLEEKIAFCTGNDMWRTKAYPQYGIPHCADCLSCGVRHHGGNPGTDPGTADG